VNPVEFVDELTCSIIRNARILKLLVSEDFVI